MGFEFLAFEFPTGARHPALRLLHDYWLARGRADRLPSRDDIDPVAMRPFLKYVILLDVDREPTRYRFRQRLVGTHIVELFAQDPTGRYVDQTSSADHYVEVYARLAAVVDTRAPVYGIAHAPTPQRSFARYEHLTVPLSSNGVDVDVLLGVRCGLGQR